MIQVDIDGHILGANKPAALNVLADASCSSRRWPSGSRRSQAA